MLHDMTVVNCFRWYLHTQYKSPTHCLSTLHGPVVILCTTSLNTNKTPHSTHIEYLGALYRLQNKERLISYTAVSN